MSRILRFFSSESKNRSTEDSSPISPGGPLSKKESDWAFDTKASSTTTPGSGDAILPVYSASSGSESVTTGKIPAPPDYLKYEVEDEELKKMLLRYDTIFIVDDSTSMNSRMMSGRTRWEEACEALSDFATLAAQYDTDGIDVHFFNSPTSITGLHVRNRNTITSIFGEMVPKGGTFIGRRIQELSQDYLKKLASCPRNRTPWPKPRNYIIITDGKARDEELLRTFMRETAKSLKTMKCPVGQLGFQFVQIGNNAGATEFLEELDGDKKHHSMDIVDTVKAELNQSFSTNFPKKVLLGGINRHVDRNISGSSSTMNFLKKW